MNIIKIILYPSPLAPFFGKEEDLKLRCKLEWPKHHSPAVEGFYAEINGIKQILVSLEAEIFADQHIQNPLTLA